MFRRISISSFRFLLAGKGLSFRTGQHFGEAFLVGVFVGFVVVAFRYLIPRQRNDNPKSAVILAEATGFNLPEGTTTFLTPQSKAMVGWERTKPSYEEEYKADAQMAQRSQYGEGFTFPCLFRVPFAATLSQHINLFERHMNIGTFGILAGNVERCFRNVPRRHRSLWQRCRQRAGDAAAACADVENRAALEGLYTPPTEFVGLRPRY